MGRAGWATVGQEKRRRETIFEEPVVVVAVVLAAVDYSITALGCRACQVLAESLTPW